MNHSRSRLAALCLILMVLLAGLEAILVEAEAANPNLAALSAEALVDISLIQELESSGFVNGLHE